MLHTKPAHPARPELVADWERLFQVFIRPEDDACRTTLIKYMERILFGLHDFQKRYVGITEAKSLKDLSESFTSTIISENPEKKLADVITCLIKEIAPHAVNVASPYFVGHMTSAIPFFMVHLKTIVAALNQNVVKLETSKVLSVIEKQVIAKIHRLIYNKGQAFYDENVQNTETTLGTFVEGGTTANLTALWVARNKRFAPKNGFAGIEADGLAAAYKAYDIDRCVVLASRLGHYSLRKSAGVLGIGNQNVIPIELDDKNKVDPNRLRQTIAEIQSDPRTSILAVVGIAGATETGTVDPLEDLADICSEHNIHFHVDAAWGGPTLFSREYKHLLKGIDRADSVTIDGHKQFYMPMSCGMLYFNDPASMDAIAYHANYVNRMGSVDLGIKTLSGSREANSLILDCALKIMGTRGYSLLIDHGIETAAAFAEEIRKRELFELVSAPELNILTYRICPAPMRERLAAAENEELRREINEKLNTVNRNLQRIQREAGKSFVSRTTLRLQPHPSEGIVVLRCVIMNPMTTLEILKEILDEQEGIFQAQLADTL
jgi:putative pyridoxal-dependent aspartate 1-decarboxylase